MATLLIVSYLAKTLFVKKILPAKYDILRCNLAFGGRDIALKEKQSCDEKEGQVNYAFDEIKSKL